jgi:hypothetical protein
MEVTMNAGNNVSTANALNKGNRGLKIATNAKAGAAASNPSLLNGEQTAVRSLKLRTYVTAGIAPCTAVIWSI